MMIWITLYMIIAMGLTFAVMDEKGGGIDFIASVFIGMIWPIMIAMVFFKKIGA